MDTKKKEMVEALESTKGIVSYACGKTGVPRSTHYKWMHDDKDYNAAVKEVTESAIDFVEGKLLQSINDGSDTAIIFFLKTKGRDRGYVEKVQVERTKIIVKPKNGTN